MSVLGDFKVGDTVWHTGRKSRGVVEQLRWEGEPAVVIRFEDWPQRTSAFDADWFRINPQMLRKTADGGSGIS